MSLILSRRNIARIAFWPLVAALLLAVISAGTSAKLNEEHSRTLYATYRQESLLASSYAAQLAQTVQQIDQTTLNLKDDWEAAPNKMSLERKRSRGLFPETGLLYASIVGPNGRILTTSLPNYTMPNLADLGFFLRQKAECCLGLLISKPEFGRRLGRRVVRFSRRLNNPDGSFGGVAVVAVDPSFLTSFQEEGLPHGDFVSVRLTSGPSLSTDSDARPRATHVFYRSDPVFHSASGTEREDGSRFKDGLARFVAWHKLQNYPLVAVAAISERDAFAAYRRLARNRRETAAFGDLLVLVFALTATGLSYRLAWRQQREEEVRATYRLATDAANEGFYMIRPVYGRDGAPADFRIEDCNEHGAALYGADRAGLIGQRISSIVPREFRQDVLALCRRAFEHGLYEDELRVPQHSPIQAAWLYRRVVRSGDGLALTVRDISEAKEHEQALTDLANSDTLTHLPNRRWLSEFLPVALARAANGNRHVALLFIDLDNFKNVNDTLGHDAGDELLQQAAHRLKHAVRGSDQVVRLGGDEFTVVLEQVDEIDDVAAIADSIVAALSEPYALSVGNSSDLEASVGISVYPQDGIDGDTLLKHADIAMYAAKAEGKGRYCFYRPHLSDALLLRLNKERLLRHAVEHDQFTVHYQPRVGLESGRLVSMEALVRWNHPERGLVYPSEFIDLAEDMGLIVPLGELVIDKVCAQLAQWMKEGLSAVPVSVNISPQQLKSGNVSHFVLACMERYHIDASLIEAELTESAVIDNSVTVSRELAELRACGIKLMIDDFGTGHSSLAQLHRLDVDVLKVDQAFTRSLCDGPEAQVLFRAIVSMASALDMCVVAEGVETSAQLNALRALACDEAQGYLISRAIEADEMATLLLRRFLLQPADRDRRVAPDA